VRPPADDHPNGREAAAGYRPLIRDLPADERPRERLRSHGPGALSNAELLAILLRTGGNGENVLRLSERLISQFGGAAGMGRISLAEMCTLKGIGQAKAAQVLAGIELGRRIVSAAPDERTTVRCSDDVVNLLRAEMVDLEHEHLKAVLLNVRNQVLGVRTVYVGNTHTAVVRAGEVFREAIRAGCPQMIVAHNHPSGDPSPSPDDVAMTRQLVEAGRLLDIEVVDHIVIARGGYVSLKERGLGFP
jgi:DNA repair protein RadC